MNRLLVMKLYYLKVRRSDTRNGQEMTVAQAFRSKSLVRSLAVYRRGGYSGRISARVV